MSMLRETAYGLLRRVGDEHRAARFGLAQTLRALDDAVPQVVQAAAEIRLNPEDIRRCSRFLEITYVLRLFAEFEGVLLDFWQNGLGRVTTPKIRVLIERIAAARGISDEDRKGTHEVREFRNDIVHYQLREARLKLPECRSRMGRFARWLPVQW